VAEVTLRCSTERRRWHASVAGVLARVQKWRSKDGRARKRGCEGPICSWFATGWSDRVSKRTLEHSKVIGLGTERNDTSERPTPPYISVSSHDDRSPSVPHSYPATSFVPSTTVWPSQDLPRTSYYTKTPFLYPLLLPTPLNTYFVHSIVPPCLP